MDLGYLFCLVFADKIRETPALFAAAKRAGNDRRDLRFLEAGQTWANFGQNGQKLFAASPLE